MIFLCVGLLVKLVFSEGNQYPNLLRAVHDNLSSKSLFASSCQIHGVKVSTVGLGHLIKLKYLIVMYGIPFLPFIKFGEL